MPLAGLGIVIWATTENGGVSSGEFQNSGAPISTSVLAWGIVSQFNAVMGANSALLVTVPDLARYSKTKNAQLWGQLISLPIGQTLCASFGIIATVSLTTYLSTSNAVMANIRPVRGTQSLRRGILEPL